MLAAADRAPGTGQVIGGVVREKTGSVTLGVKMFRAVYRQVARFLNWINRTGSGSSASRATNEAADHRRDVQSRSGGDWGVS